MFYYAFLIDPLTIFISSTGLSFLSVSINPILFTIAIPEWILPFGKRKKNTSSLNYQKFLYMLGEQNLTYQKLYVFHQATV